MREHLCRMANPLTPFRRRLAGYPNPAPSPNGDGWARIGADRRGSAERCAWSLVWLGILVGGVELWESWTSWPVIDVLAPVLVAVALAGFVVCWWAPSPRAWYHEWAALLGALCAIAAPQVVYLHTRLAYSTDSAALDQAAANVLVHGHDPYGRSLSSAAAHFLQNPGSYWTYLAGGGHVGTVSYPAGSFLVYAPALALGFHHVVVDWMDLYFWLASAILLFFLVPRSLRWLAVLVSLVGIFTTLFADGNTDAAVLPFVLLALWRWDRYGRGRGAGVASWVGPVALGVACAIKQTPWFLVPFLVLGVGIEARRSGRRVVPLLTRHLATLVAVFLAVNLPFMVMNPAGWWQGITLPFFQPLVADGQGLVSLALHGLTGGADLRLLTVASGLCFLATVVALAAWYRPLKRIWPLLVPVPFFFAPRSFTSYLIDLLPAAFVALVSVDTPAGPVLPAKRRWSIPTARLAVASLAAGVGVVTGVAFTSAPLSLTYLSADIGPGQQHVYSVTVAVTNTTGRTLRPRFMVDMGAPHPNGFWTTRNRRPVVVGPHATVGVTLYPPPQTLAYLPPWAADFVVQAYTTGPEALSTTNDIWHNYIPKKGPES
jgi:uncharacterized membrane protein